jgi:hypothetical protein
MKNATAALIVLCLLLPAAARADDVEALLRSLASDQQELAQTQLQQSERVRLNEQDMGLHKTYKDNFGELEGRVRRVRKTRDDYVAPRQAERSGLVNGWNSRCSAQAVGALPKERYEACERERAQIEPKVNALQNAVDQAYANAKREADPLVGAMERQKAEMDKINARTRQRFDAWQQDKVKVDRLKAKLEQTRLQLVSACDKPQSKEALKHCHSIGWDGANKTLPPLGNIRSPFAATRN